jgi:hypothetical protein
VTEPLATRQTATPPAGAARRAVGDMSIERRLPLLMTAVVAGVVVASLLMTYRTLATAARANATRRLQEVAAMLATTVEQSSRQRAAVIGRVVRDDAVTGALRRANASGGAPSPSVAGDTALVAALRRIAQPSDSGLPTAFWSADRRPLAMVGALPAMVPTLRPELDSVPPPALVRSFTDSLRIGAPFTAGGRLYYHVVAPIDGGGERLGYLVALRRIGYSARLVAQLRALTGEDVSLYVQHRAAPLWASSSGQPSGGPEATRDSQLVTRPGQGRLLSASAAAAGTPW